MARRRDERGALVPGKLGYAGRPAVAEELLLVRDGMLAADTGGYVHICHVSTKGSVASISARLKAAGVQITAETCPQYFTLTEEEIEKQGAMAKVNPPLRTQEDVEAILGGLKDGTLDCIVTDHAPHTAEEKSREVPKAPSGMVGLETSLALSLTVLHHRLGLPLSFVIEKMSTAPAKILQLKAGTLQPGAPADIVLFDPDEKWTVRPEHFASKGRNTPFAGWELERPRAPHAGRTGGRFTTCAWMNCGSERRAHARKQEPNRTTKTKSKELLKDVF